MLYRYFLTMFLLIHKPKWYTSFDVIHKIKKFFPKKTKIGHAGTLDPMATWLLIIAIDKDTKRLSEFVWLDKEYIATIDFSKTSDTWDMDYRKEFGQLDTAWLEAPHLQDLQWTLDQKLWVSQRPLTPFSAKKVRGKKLYEYARAWEPIFIDCDMELLWYKILDYNFPLLQIQLHVWSGTYIRSIAHWLWLQMWLGGVLTSLHRSKIGKFAL